MEEPLECQGARQSLQADLENILLRQQAGSLSLYICSLFEMLPKFQGLKDKQEVNTTDRTPTPR